MFYELNAVELDDINGGSGVVVSAFQKYVLPVVIDIAIRDVSKAVGDIAKSTGNAIYTNYMNGYDPSKIVHTRPIDDGMRP